jgi:hypothetical protein
MTSLATWLLERSYIYRGNKALNMIFFIFIHVNHFLSSYIFVILILCMHHVTDFYVVY